MQEVLHVDFDESGMVREVELWGTKNSIELPVANQLFSRYRLTNITGFLLFIHLCYH